MLLEIHQRGAVADTLALRPVIHAKHPQRRVWRNRGAADQGDEHGWAGDNADVTRQACARLAAEREGNRPQERGQPHGRARRGSNDLRQSLSEDAMGTGGRETEELADMEHEADGMPAPR
jgi:hypothetical protein